MSLNRPPTIARPACMMRPAYRLAYTPQEASSADGRDETVIRVAH